MNASQGVFALGLSGIVEVDVTGPAPNLPGGVRVDTHATGALSGTFGGFGNTTIAVTGTFSSDATELWEGEDYLPVASNSSTAYVITVKIVITAQVTANLWVNATTSYGSLPPFNLSVGESSTVPFASNLSAATSFTSFGYGQHMENRTALAGTRSRHVLARENVSVEAGTFSAYRLNESLGAFPGLAAVAPSNAANETAWFSNDVGFYVKRVAFVNGTPVAEMRLKAYTYPAVAAGLSPVDIALLAGVPIMAAVLVVLSLLRRRKRREASKASSGTEPVGELPPRREEGRP